MQPPWGSKGTLNTIEILFLVSAQNDFITGSLKVGGAVGIVDPVRQLIEEKELWGQVGKPLFSQLPRIVNNLS